MRVALLVVGLALVVCALTVSVADAASVSARSLEHRRVARGIDGPVKAKAKSKSPSKSAKEQSHAKGKDNGKTKGKGKSKGQAQKSSKESKGQAKGKAKLPASAAIDDSAAGKTFRSLRRGVGKTFATAKCTTLSCIGQKLNSLVNGDADAPATAPAAGKTVPTKVSGGKSKRVLLATAASAGRQAIRTRVRASTGRVSFGPVNCALAMPTWGEFETEVLAEQGVLGVNAKKQKTRVVSVKTPTLATAKAQLDDWHAAPANPQLRLLMAMKIAHNQYVGGVLNTQFGHALADVARNRHFRRSGIKGATKNRRQARQQSYVNTNALLMTCVATYVNDKLTTAVANPANALGVTYAWFPATPNTPQATAGAVLRAGAVGGNTCGTLPVYESAAPLMTPGLSLTTKAFVGYLKPIGVELTHVGAASDTWVHTAFIPSECHYNLVPATATVWMSDALSGCHIYAATNAADELLIIHANANAIANTDDNYHAKLQCARQMLDHVNAAHPNPFTPYDELTHSRYTGHMTGGEVIPWGVHVGAGVWQFRYNEFHLPAGPALPGTITAHPWTGAAPTGFWTAGANGPAGPTNLANERRWPKLNPADPDPC